MGSFPDLRYSPMLQSDVAFKAVVIDGVLTENGMLPFPKVLSSQDAESIRAYLTQLANEVRNSPPAPFFGPGGPRPAGAQGQGASAPAPEVGLHQ
jgi:hypothetical protein